MSIPELNWGGYLEQEGQVVEYYETSAQWIRPNMTTNFGTLIDGQWGNMVTTEYPDPIQEKEYYEMRTSHPCNGILYLLGQLNDHVDFLRYQYMQDIGSLATGWSLGYDSDSPVVSLTLTLSNLGDEQLESDDSVFQPGGAISFDAVLGPENIQMGKFYLDEVKWDRRGETVTLDARNAIGWFLRDGTIDMDCIFTGTLNEIVEAIMERAGVPEFIVQPGLSSLTYTYEFKPDDTFLDALQQMADSMSNPDPALEVQVLEDWNGVVYFGHKNWLDQYIPNSAYEFHEGTDLFSRGTTKNADAAYNYICGSCEDEADDQITLYSKVPVATYDNWGVRHHKTKHIQAPKPMDQAGLDAWVTSMADAYQYMGKSESFKGIFRPDLLVGDVAKINKSNGSTYSVGIITEVSHEFSKTGGYTTSFSVDSGGIATDGEAYIIHTKMAKDNGRNRQMRMTDIIKIVSGG